MGIHFRGFSRKHLHLLPLCAHQSVLMDTQNFNHHVTAHLKSLKAAVQSPVLLTGLRYGQVGWTMLAETLLIWAQVPHVVIETLLSKKPFLTYLLSQQDTLGRTPSTTSPILKLLPRWVEFGTNTELANGKVINVSHVRGKRMDLSQCRELKFEIESFRF